MSIGITFITMLLFGMILLTGAALVAHGLLGDAVAGPPICARCRHGIAVLSGATSAPQSPCPECGSDLLAPQAVVYFRRKRRVRRIVAGFSILASAFLVPILLRLISFLLFEGPSIGPQTTHAALLTAIADPTAPEFFAFDEAARRMAAGTMSDAELKEVVLAGRTRRTAMSGGYPMTAEMDLLVAADQRSLINDEELTTYLRSFFAPPSLGMHAIFRPPFNVGLGPFPVESLNGAHRALALKHVTIDGKDVPLLDYQDAPLGRIGQAEFGRLKFDGPPGGHMLRATFEEVFRIAPANGNAANAAPRLTVERIVELPLTFIAQGAPTWVTTESPERRTREVEQACLARAIAIDRDAAGDTCSLRVDAMVQSVRNLTLAFEIVVVLDGTEYVVGRHVVANTASMVTEYPMGSASVAIPVPRGLLPHHAVVLFRPKPELAEPIVGVERVWGGVVECRDVPVVTTLPQGSVPNGDGEAVRP
ncbi:MAG: hypothetical protein JNL80_10360 [Phycisphaerae bacterium]|jgi:hypothetical protein|nr:hypothetical protein [Phycisphaerae bacterium]